MMRIGLTVGCVLLSWGVAACPADEPPQTRPKAVPIDPGVQAILREAREIVLKQDEDQHFWSERVLLHIAKVQVRASDFEGALESISGSTEPYERNAALVDLAEALARAGEMERALDVLRLLGSDHGWRQDFVDDGVQLRWIEHLIASEDLDRAREAVKQLKSDRYRPEGLRKLAVAYAQSGAAAQAAEHFTLAVDAAANANLIDEVDLARTLWETADAQLTVGAVDSAKATIRRLVESVERKDPWSKVIALRESAVLAAKASDDQTAHRLFRQAIDAQKTVGDAMNRIGAIKLIALGQAGVGYIDDARKTASTIKRSDRGEVRFAIVLAQLKANDVDGALRTALSEYNFHDRDGALIKIVDHQIVNSDLKSALTSAEKFHNPSSKATAILKVATAHARSGDRKTAADVAARIDLTPRGLLAALGGQERFDYRRPLTWGVCYNDGFGGTGAMRRKSNRLAAEVATAAMALAQALGQQPAESYAIQFNDIYLEEVVLALARAHAASGDATEALSWAKQIGSSDKVNSREDFQAIGAVQRRIHALVGVAEGILHRSGAASLEPGT